MAKFDTSFDFGFNATKPKKPKAAGGKKPRKRRSRSSKKSKAYWSGQFGS